ncbi:DMT family transporter [Aquicella lusitana]|uniref:Drug/metabolite transporter (DMT)-like permease n=1 Tax=Aquicella lusitana TaxID=254246 RepID=A0A370G147_9COXI|nr:DMT family transporter [Aquicella lusitana]RDI37591.1 drug/metabolite transporter (DMT)-like permease [Aquicella lusitana]VVC73898.1 hypothetical protein AQULUS_16530 [Aquicella lusitana]
MVASAGRNEKGFTFVLSMLFIILYGSGFVGAKLGFPYAKPLSFLVVRFALTSFLLLLVALWMRSKWPSSWKETLHIGVSGIFLVCFFSVGTWVSMDMGVPPAISALITALQPIAVTVASYFVFNKKVAGKQWLGLILGLMGVGLVVGENAVFDAQYSVGILMSFLGLLGLTVGNLYQKRFCASMNIFTGGVIQSAVSGLLCLLLALSFDSLHVTWSGQFLFALGWMSVVISLGATSFLYILLRKGESHKVASLFYLIPAVTAVISYLVFKTTLDAVQITGMMLAAVGVALVNLNFSFLKSKAKETEKPALQEV